MSPVSTEASILLIYETSPVRRGLFQILNNLRTRNASGNKHFKTSIQIYFFLLFSCSEVYLCDYIGKRGEGQD